MDHTARATELIAKNRNLLVPWYLMLSWLYYERDISIVSDACFDLICKRLDAEWDEVEHRHKRLVSRDMLKAGTGFALPFHMFPSIITSAANSLASEVKQ